MLCYTLVFLAIIPQLDAPRIYMNEGFFNDQETCEVQLIKSAKQMDPSFAFKQGEKGVGGFYSDKSGKTFYQCVSFHTNPKAICNQTLLDGVLDIYEDCDCSVLNSKN